MSPERKVRPNGIATTLALLLVAAGVVDGVALAMLPSDAVPASSVVGTLPMLPLWAAVILTVGTRSVHLSARYVVSLAGVVGAGSLAAWSALALTREPTLPLTVQLRVFALIGGVTCIALWGMWDVIRRRRQQLEAAERRDPASWVPLPPFPDPSDVASSPSTPARGWNQVATPWPRANEDDPDGTLLRPPKRRA